jgi:Beta-ketoacyl synthase, N-terminal domain
LPSGEPIAIVGIGCRLPGAVRSPDDLWNLLVGGVDAVVEVPQERWRLPATYHPDPGKPGRMNTRGGGFLDQVEQIELRPNRMGAQRTSGGLVIAATQPAAKSLAPDWPGFPVSIDQEVGIGGAGCGVEHPPPPLTRRSDLTCRPIGRYWTYKAQVWSSFVARQEAAITRPKRRALLHCRRLQMTITRIKAPRKSRNPASKPAYERKMLEALARGMSPARAAKVAGVGRSTAYLWRREDPEFAQKWDDAVADGIDLLEDEVCRRALEGSDKLLMFLLERRRPEVWARPKANGPKGFARSHDAGTKS